MTAVTTAQSGTRVDMPTGKCDSQTPILHGVRTVLYGQDLVASTKAGREVPLAGNTVLAQAWKNVVCLYQSLLSAIAA